DRNRKIARTLRAWRSLITGSLTLPLAPSTPSLRRAIIAGETLQSKLPLVRLDTLVSPLLSDADYLSLTALPTVDHNCSLFELLVLGTITRAIKPRRSFEIGTFDGRSALAIAANAPHDSHVFTLNLPPEPPPTRPDGSLGFDEQLASKVTSGHRWQAHPEAVRISQLFGNSLAFDFSPYAPSQLIFIDGGHAEPIVRSDTARCLDFIDRNDGIILWHDATRYGVKPALEDLARHGRRIHLIDGTSIAFLRFLNRQEVPFPY
ncbi:MAG: class I SAM-dependent methyltransferase, partial [Phycisphaerales bacterium]